MDTDANALEQIERWYRSVCDGDWEHTYGIFISNIDNPGWSLKVELKDTYLYGAFFKDLNVQRKNDDDWVLCKIEDGNFQGYCGPSNLTEMLEVFLDWANKS